MTSVVSGKSSSTGLLVLKVASDDTLDTREFAIEERISSLFTIKLTALCENPDIELDTVVGHPARFVLRTDKHERAWNGICTDLDQIRVEESGLSTYELTLAPTLWLATQRRNYRIFQQISEPDIVQKLLKEWDIEPELKLTGTYKKRKFRVQYGESDYAFICRMLEDAGISFFFRQDGEETKLVLSDEPQKGDARDGDLVFLDNPMMANGREYVTSVRVGRRVRPGKYTMRDHDYRRAPANQPVATAKSGGGGVEEKLERYHYTPGAFLFGAERGEDTPVADDKGKTRSDDKEGDLLARKRLEAKQASAKVCSFNTNAHDLAPGIVMTIQDHPKSEFGGGKKWLIVTSTLSGTSYGEWTHRGEARSADAAYRPPVATPKPKVNGVESATVVGPPGEEIHCDEFGRVRVHFHWDRESKMDDNSSCWIHVSQPWSGSAFGAVNLPRVGQEVLVDFLGGDPDRPVIVGRVFTNLQKVPYKLPDSKTQSGWKTSSSPGGVGFNELRFDDAKGKELVHVQAEKDFTEVIKNNQSSTVLANRSAEVTASDSVTVGGSQSFDVVGSQHHTIGEDQNNNIVGSRSSVIKSLDSIDVGTSQSLTVGDGVGYVFKNDKTVLVTTGLASIRIDGNSISLDAKGKITIAANGELVLSGSEVRIDGGPKVLLNCYEKKPANVRTTGKAKTPKNPKKPGGGGDTGNATEELGRPSATQGPLEFWNEQLPPVAAGSTLELGEIMTMLPLSPAAAPSLLEIGKELSSAITGGVLGALAGDTSWLSKIMVIKEEASQVFNLYKLAKDEGLASLPSSLQIFGPFLPQPFGCFGDLGAAVIEDLVNIGNLGGIFQVGSSPGIGGSVGFPGMTSFLPMDQQMPSVSSGASVFQGQIPPILPHIGGIGETGTGGIGTILKTFAGTPGGTEQFMAVRTQAAPWNVNGHAVTAQARVYESKGDSSKVAYARALNDSGVALYQGNFNGEFSKIKF